ncbi:MAG: hypothetical protein L0H53_14255 [Candidatus Nitrosocosmicus sp.]|nr:hypothetical protein [Candidatus Nitrosocosmicus sp.]
MKKGIDLLNLVIDFHLCRLVNNTDKSTNEQEKLLDSTVKRRNSDK